LDTFYDLLKSEMNNPNSMPGAEGSIEKQLKHPENFRLLLKAFQSKNTKVLHSLYRLMRDLNDIEDRFQEYI